MHAYTYTHTHTHMHIGTHTHTPACIHIQTHTSTCTHTHTHTHTRTRTRTHTHTQIKLKPDSNGSGEERGGVCFVFIVILPADVLACKPAGYSAKATLSFCMVFRSALRLLSSMVCSCFSSSILWWAVARSSRRFRELFRSSASCKHSSKCKCKPNLPVELICVQCSHTERCCGGGGGGEGELEGGRGGVQRARGLLGQS